MMKITKKVKILVIVAVSLTMCLVSLVFLDSFAVRHRNEIGFPVTLYEYDGTCFGLELDYTWDGDEWSECYGYLKLNEE